MKRILVFIDWFLPGYKAGGPVRSMANMIDHLSDRFAFDVVTRNSEYMESIPYPGVKSNQWNSLSTNVRVYYSSQSNESLKLWRQIISEGRYDVIYINGIYSPKYSILPLLAAKMEKQRKIVVAPRGMLASSAINVKKTKKKLFLSLTRQTGAYRGITFHATNEQEAELCRQHLNSKAHIYIAANLPKKQDVHHTAIQKKENEIQLVSLARIAPEKNTLYAIQCLENINTPKVTLRLYGQIYDSNYWQECQRKIAELPANISVTYEGTVPPDEVGATIAQNHVLLLPSRGENFGHVILESLMVGRPVLISDQTPWRELEARMAGWDLPLSDMFLFASKIEELCRMDQNQYDRWSEGAAGLAREFVEDKALLGSYEEMLGK